MFKLFKNFLAVALLALASAAQAQDTEALSGPVKDQIERINALIQQQGGRWVAGETQLSNLSKEDWMYRVGLDFEPFPAFPAPEVYAAEVPAAMDWRDHDGNFVTPAKNQQKCGSCWAFSMTGALESYALLAGNTPGRDLDLSEQVMLSCSGAGTCNGGRLNAGYLQRAGLPEESVYPYTATDGSCATAAPGWQANAFKIGAWGSVPQDLARIKAALTQYGPLPIAFMVYEDFKHYKSGIYSYTTGKRLGGHAVLLVGYNDAESYFIVKNSWDTGWGENGFFRIAYSEMDNIINFGMSTIAYWSKTVKPGTPGAKFDADAAWERVQALTRPSFE